MLAAFKRSVTDVVLRDVPMPEPGWGEVLIKVMSCGVCGGDLGESLEYERFGHEVAGEVVALGEGARRLRVGERVVVESGSFCGVCDVCRNGRPDLCRRVADGTYCGFAEYAVVPEKNAVQLPDDLSYAHAALIEPLGVAIDLVKTAEVSMGDHVLILGAGSIGLMAMQLARRAGASRIWAAMRSSPGIYFPLAREALRSGMIDADAMISHTAPLEDIAELMHAAGCERDRAVKCVMLAQE